MLRTVQNFFGVVLLGVLTCTSPTHASEAMAQAAQDYLAALSSSQRELSLFEFDSEERERFHFIPSEMFPRSGLPMKQMDAAQRESLRVLLLTGLSQSGYLTASAVIELENVLKEIEVGGRFVRDDENYLVSVFGTPDPSGSWAWRFEGHHLSLHFTVVAGTLTVSAPTFFGANPAEVREGPQTGTRVLAAREDTGRALALALDAAQRGKAVIDARAPNDIITANNLPIDPLVQQGIVAVELTGAQKLLLRELINVYTGDMADEIAAARWERIEQGGFDSILFAWMGGLERGMPHYYRVQGPSFLIEYDNVQNDANHIHSIWRDFEGDFGRDLLREHRNEVAH